MILGSQVIWSFVLHGGDESIEGGKDRVPAAKFRGDGHGLRL